MRVTISYLLATLLCVSGCIATQTIPPEPKKEKIVEKKLPTHTYLDEFIFDPYPSIGSVNYSNTGRLIGSGVLISPNLVLTAAHVAEGRSDLMFVEYDGDTHCVEKVIYHPTYVSGVFRHDIAILVLETSSDEGPVALIESESLLCKGMKLTTVGYGTGRKRFSNFGMFWYYGRLICNPQFMIMLPTEASIWFGDSGGAVLTLDNKLVGIMSYFGKTPNGKIYENGCASIEYYRKWIKEVQQDERQLENVDR